MNVRVFVAGRSVVAEVSPEDSESSAAAQAKAHDLASEILRTDLTFPWRLRVFTSALRPPRVEVTCVLAGEVLVFKRVVESLVVRVLGG